MPFWYYDMFWISQHMWLLWYWGETGWGIRKSVQNVERSYMNCFLRQFMFCGSFLFSLYSMKMILLPFSFLIPEKRSQCLSWVVFCIPYLWLPRKRKRILWEACQIPRGLVQTQSARTVSGNEMWPKNSLLYQYLR